MKTEEKQLIDKSDRAKNGEQFDLAKKESRSKKTNLRLFARRVFPELLDDNSSQAEPEK